MNRRRILIACSLACGIFFLLGLLLSTQSPKVKAWTRVKIEEESRRHLPVRILPGQLNLSFFPIGASLTQVRILPKDELKDSLESVYIESLSFSISPWLLLQGKLRISHLEVIGAVVAAQIPRQEKSNKDPLKGLFDLIAKVPAQKVTIEDTALRLKLMEPKFLVNADDLHLIAEKRRNGALHLDLVSANVNVVDPEAKASVRISAETEVLLARQMIAIDRAVVRRGESFISISGELSGDTEALKFDQLKLTSEMEFQLESMRNWAARTFKNLAHLPQARGRATLKSDISRTQNSSIDARFSLHTTGLAIDHFEIDQIKGEGTYKANQLHIPRLTVANSAGEVRITDFHSDLGEEKRFSSKLDLTQVQLHELLKTLGVGEIPVYLQASVQTPCEGTLTPKFTVTCKGKARSENLLVRGSMKSKSAIVAVRELEATGEVTIDTEKVSYKAELSAPHSSGRSEGEISYKTGFKIGFEADRLDLKDITNLADLKLEGVGKVKGSTEGGARSATVSLSLDGTDLWLQDFWLGNGKASIGYQAGQLSFSGIQGHYNVSRYAADVKIDVVNHQIQINGRAPFIEARDFLKVVSRKVTLPFQITGTGQASVRAHGPLDLSRLSYDLKSSLFKGSAAGETFDQAHFDVQSVAGEVKAERVQVIKGPSNVTLSGTAHPDGTINTLIRARGLRLEDSALVSASGVAVSGIADFDMKLSGPILSPLTDLRGTLTKTTLADQAMPDSTYRMKFTNSTIEGEGAFLGHVLKANFIVPLDSSSPFYLKASTKDWNYAPLFAAVSGIATRKDYEGNLSSEVEISSPSGGFWNSSGTIKVADLSLSRGNLSLRSSEPLRMSMKNGHLIVEKLDLSGENLFLKVTNSPNPKAKIDIQVNGKLDMTLVALLTPFFEDLRGILSFALNFQAGPSHLELLGSAYVDRGFLKFFDFPHPLENISADLLFNQRKILFNTLKSEFAGGRILATGGMELKGYKNYPLNISGSFDKVNLNVPDKIRTSGSGNFSLGGEWFPFLLKLDYDVRDGMITKEFGGEATQTDGIRRDFFLPELILQNSFSPLQVDLNINLSRGVAIKNELVEGRVRGKLSVKGRPEKPGISGTLTTDSDTQVFFKDTAFDVTSSNIQFDGGTDINPKIYLAARSRVQEYDISLLIQGTANKVDIGLSTVPPLPNNEIISLLALGATESQLSSSINSNEQASSSATQIGSGVIKKNPLSDLVKDKLGFDVQFSPGFDETGNSAVQKIVVSRQFNRSFGVTASRSIGKVQETEARARYRLNERLSLIGSWQGKDYTEGTDQAQTESQNPNKFGLDIEYKFEFK